MTKRQTWIAVPACVLVAIITMRLDLTASLSEIRQILSRAMFERMSINQPPSRGPGPHAKPALDKPLNLFD
jgi:hypothetical protein